MFHSARGISLSDEDEGKYAQVVVYVNNVAILIITQNINNRMVFPWRLLFK